MFKFIEAVIQKLIANEVCHLWTLLTEWQIVEDRLFLLYPRNHVSKTTHLPSTELIDHVRSFVWSKVFGKTHVG